MTELTVLRTKVRISPLFFALLTLFFLVDRNGIAGKVLLFSAFHEISHIIAMFCLGVYPKTVIINFYGFRIELPGNLKSTEKCFILSTGFILNFVLSLFFFSLNNFLCGFINLLIGFMTALPVASSDGGAVLREILDNIIPEKAEKIYRKTSVCISAVLILVLSVLIILTKNYFLFIAIGYIIYSASGF